MRSLRRLPLLRRSGRVSGSAVGTATSDHLLGDLTWDAEPCRLCNGLNPSALMLISGPCRTHPAIRTPFCKHTDRTAAPPWVGTGHRDSRVAPAADRPARPVHLCCRHDQAAPPPLAGSMAASAQVEMRVAQTAQCIHSCRPPPCSAQSVPATSCCWLCALQLVSGQRPVRQPGDLRGQVRAAGMFAAPVAHVPADGHRTALLASRPLLQLQLVLQLALQRPPIKPASPPTLPPPAPTCAQGLGLWQLCCWRPR